MESGDAMEATPLMRFVYATLAMRRRWEAKGASAEAATSGGGGEQPAQVPLVEVPEAAAQAVGGGNEVDGIHPKSSSVEEGDVVGSLMPVLEVVLAAQMAVAGGGDLDDSIVRLLDELCEMARSVGAFADLVKVLITMLVDVDDAKDEALVHGVSEIILQLCFEARKFPGRDERSFAPTIYLDEVLAQIDGTLSALFDVAATDDLAGHVGVRCLADTHAIIVSHFENLCSTNSAGVV